MQEETKIVKQKKLPFRMNLTIHIVILGVANIIVLIAFIFFLSRLGLKAEEVKKLKNLGILSQSWGDIGVVSAEIEKSKDKVETILGRYADEEGLLRFVEAMDRLKSEGVLVSFGFTNDKTVEDKGGNKGLPIVLEFQGESGRVGDALSQVQSLGFLLKPVHAVVERDLEGNSIKVSYGLFLYVSQD